MAITHVIAHHIQRPHSTAEAKFSKRDSELPMDGKVEELLRELKRTYCNRTGKSYGLFSDDIGNYPFSGMLKNYCSDNMSFASFSQKAVEHFKIELEKDEAVIDSHLLMFQEKLSDADYLYLFMVDHDEALYIDGDLTVKSTHNIGSLMLGARVNLSEWLNGGSNYLSLLRLRGDKPLTDAFFNWVGFADQQLDIYKDTTEFLDIVSAYSQKMPEEEAHETKTKVVDYCLEQDKNGKPVEFEKLSEVMSEAKPKDFSDFVEQIQEKPKKELIPHRARLKQFIRLSGRDEHVSMSFDAQCLGENIHYNHENETLTLTNIPKALKSRILEHLREGIITPDRSE